MSKKVVGVLSVVLLSIAVGGGYWLGQKGTDSAMATKSEGGGAAPAGGAPAGVSIEAIKVAKASMPQGITAVGSLRSDESITLRPEVAGRISALRSRRRTRGQRCTLVKLDPSVTEAEAQQARANLTLAKAKYNRAVDLEKKGFISGQARDEAENNLKSARPCSRWPRPAVQADHHRAVLGDHRLALGQRGDYVKEGTDMVNLESVDTLKVDFACPRSISRKCAWTNVANDAGCDAWQKL